MISWCIWVQCNKFIFHGTQFHINIIIKFVPALYKNDLPLHDVTIPKSGKFQHIMWIKPIDVWTTLSVDATFSNYQTAAGLVIRSLAGKPIFITGYLNMVMSATTAEV